MSSKWNLTHLITLPLTDETFQNGFGEFKESVIKNYGEDYEQFFVSQARFHLTLGVLRLISDEDVQRAIACLEGCRNFVKGFLINNKLTLAIKGLGFFPGRNPKQANVIYANVSHSTDPYLLQTMVDSIRGRFEKENLLAERVMGCYNIHATLMKTKKTEFKYFDFEQLLKQYNDFSFGKGVVEEIDLSLFSGGLDDEYYLSAGKLLFSPLY